MNVIVTAEVTYEFADVKSVEHAIEVYQSCVKRHLWDNTQYIGTKQMFITEMNEDGTFMDFPEIWDIEDVE